MTAQVLSPSPTSELWSLRLAQKAYRDSANIADALYQRHRRLEYPIRKRDGRLASDRHFFCSAAQQSTPFIIERGQPFDPSILLGSAGLYDAAAALGSMGVKHPEGPVYAASHARAIVDLVLVSIPRDETLDHIGLDDWMPRGEEKAEVFELLIPIIPKLSENQAEVLRRWIAENVAGALRDASEERDPKEREAGLQALEGFAPNRK